MSDEVSPEETLLGGKAADGKECNDRTFVRVLSTNRPSERDEGTARKYLKLEQYTGKL